MVDGTEPRKVVLGHREPTVREIVREALRAAGVDVWTTALGEEAVRWALEVRPAAVLLSLELENVDGWQVARILRIMGPATLPVVALTADAREATRVRALAAGFSSYVTLPVRPVDLVEHVERGWPEQSNFG